VALARRFGAHGLPVSVFTGWGAVEFRMYPDGVRQLAEGWTKNLASGAGLVDPLAAGVAVWWVTACIGLTATSLRHAVGADWHGLAVAAACWAAIACELRWMWRRVGSFGWLSALLHPVATAAFVMLFMRSAWATVVRRRVRWSGRPIVLAARPASILFEAANPRHAHEYRCFEGGVLDDDQVLVAGVIDTLTNFVEHPEVVADRIERAGLYR